MVEQQVRRRNGPDLWCLTGVDLLCQVGEDVLAEPRVGERVLEGVDAHEGHCHGGEHDARRPALGEGGEGLGAHRRHALAGPSRHHLDDLVRAETELLDTDDPELALESELAGPESGFIPAEDDETDVRRQVGDQVVERRVQRR